MQGYSILDFDHKIRRSQKSQLLIVEDDRDLNQGLCKALRLEGFEVLSCLNTSEAHQQLIYGVISLVLLDVNLPDSSGLGLLRKIKLFTPEVPVILLTAEDTDSDIAEGLEQGADDYITKPLSLSVLRARINAQLRKTSLRSVRIDHFFFDFAHMQFFVGQKAVALSKPEQKLLRLLVENRGITVSRSKLVDHIWTDSAECVEENALSVTVSRLRSKLGAQKYIKTVYGTGYCWENKQAGTLH